MSKNKATSLIKDVIIKSYTPGDESQILDFLNLCYGEWGTIQKWRSRYIDYPTFDEDNILLIKVNNRIIGHGSIHFRNLIVRNHKINTASLTDAAVHPRYRGRGLYAELVGIRLKIAKSKGASLSFTWHLKGSNAYNHNKRIGFIEIKQSPIYMKVIRPEKVIRSGLFDLLHKNQKLKEALQGLGSDIYFRLGKYEFSILDLLSEDKEKLRKNQSKIEIVLDENSLYVIANFRNMTKLKRIMSLIMLMFLRRAEIKFSSFKGLLNLVHKGVAIIDSI